MSIFGSRLLYGLLEEKEEPNGSSLLHKDDELVIHAFSHSQLPQESKTELE